MADKDMDEVKPQDNEGQTEENDQEFYHEIGKTQDKSMGEDPATPNDQSMPKTNDPWEQNDEE